MNDERSPEETVLDKCGVKSDSRRRFLNRIGGSAATMAALTATGGAREFVLQGGSRADQAYQVREQAARRELQTPIPDHTDNGDEGRYPNKIGSYSKGLPHNRLGEVDLASYNSLLAALKSEQPSDFENINIGFGTKLTNPQAGLAF